MMYDRTHQFGKFERKWTQKIPWKKNECNRIWTENIVMHFVCYTQVWLTSEFVFLLQPRAKWVYLFKLKGMLLHNERCALMIATWKLIFHTIHSTAQRSNSMYTIANIATIKYMPYFIEYIVLFTTKWYICIWAAWW